MKTPQSPPNFAVLFEKFTQQHRLPALMQIAERIQDSDEYYHWDELRRRPVRHGQTHEEEWFVLKMKRKVAERRFPLTDCKGRFFTYSIPERVLELLHEIDFGAGGFIGMPEPIANPHTRDRYLVSSLIQESITSSQLEGAATTRAVAKEMLRSGRTPKDKSEQMILNNFRTMQEIIRIKDQPLTTELVMSIHRFVTDQALDNPEASGRFRRADEEVSVMDDEHHIVHHPPAAGELPERMKQMCDFANGRIPDQFIPPVIRAILLHFWLAYDHPFVDGNGRTARALFYWSMLHHGFWLFEFISISGILVKAPAKYARAFLHTETDENDLNYFILHQADVIKKAIAELHSYLDRKQRENKEAEKHLKVLLRFNHRQQALIAHALKHPAHEYTIASHRRSHGVVYATARADLMELHRMNLLSQLKRGKAWVYFPVQDMAKQLEVLSRAQ